MDRWTKLLNLDSRLAELESDIKAASPDGKHFCANMVWVRQLAPRERPILELMHDEYETEQGACRVCQL